MVSWWCLILAGWHFLPTTGINCWSCDHSWVDWPGGTFWETYGFKPQKYGFTATCSFIHWYLEGIMRWKMFPSSHVLPLNQVFAFMTERSITKRHQEQHISMCLKGNNYHIIILLSNINHIGISWDIILMDRSLTGDAPLRRLRLRSRFLAIRIQAVRCVDEELPDRHGEGWFFFQ